MRSALAFIVLFALAVAAAATRAEDSTIAIPGRVDYSCVVDADCTVKDIGNCCGYYPACVNRDSPTFPQQVLAECERKGLAGVCGFPSIQSCRCEAKRCAAVNGPGASGEVR